MAAPDLETLLDFETNVEDAAQTFLASETGLAASKINLTLDQDTLQTPRIEVKFDVGEALDPPDMKDPGTSSELEYRKYTGTLNVMVMTRASKNGSQTDHRTYRAQVRAACLLNASNFSATTLPYYDISYLRPTGTDYTIDGDLAVSTLTFDLRLQIRTDAWPADA